MRVSRALLECLVFAVGTTLAIGQAAEISLEPILGPAVPLNADLDSQNALRLALAEPELGPIIPIAGTIASENESSPLTFPKDEAQYLSGAEAMPNPHFGVVPIRVIGHPMAAPLIEPNTLAFAPALPGPIHPDQIQFHLNTLADQLSYAGLPGEARKIQEFQQQFQHDHYQRLLIAHKESQLRMLQAEIASLKQIVEPVARDAQISLQVRFIQLNSEGCETFIQNLGRIGVSAKCGEPLRLDQENTAPHGFFEVETKDANALVNQLIELGHAKVITEPHATVLNGRGVRFLSGGEIALPDKQGVTQNAGRFQGLGPSILANPQVIDSTWIRLKFIFECTQPVSTEATDAGGPGLRCPRIETVVEIASGKTVAIINLPIRDDKGLAHPEDATTHLVLITPEIVLPAPPVISSESPLYHPAPAGFYRPVVEAKAIGGR